MKSAYELAMERLREKDRAEGVTKRKPLTAAQKTKIAEARQAAKARKAELRILHDGRMAGAGPEPEKLAEEEEKYQIDMRRIDAALEEKIAEIKAAR